MAHIEASFFTTRFEDEKFSQKMVEALTQAVGSVLGEEAANDTAVVLHGIEPCNWGYRGKLLG
ncbi:tautomerase family protein [Nocardioides daejeonensis]|uniref:tautomerase family protein n=1 Tax=Nocardioides daejeonensis TaxID=1046556 RepID=UPI000D748779|nr:tautomerase family protein [Nocardioides daejeonensis]